MQKTPTKRPKSVKKSLNLIVRVISVNGKANFPNRNINSEISDRPKNKTVLNTIQSSPLPIEKLKTEYQKIKKLREQNKIIARRKGRGKISQTLKFIQRMKTLDFAAGQVKSNLPETISDMMEDKITYQDLENIGIQGPKFIPLVDLGSFNLKKLKKGKLNLKKLNNLGIKEIVIMEDRDPEFFLNYSGYFVEEKVPLNRHGDPLIKWEMQDFKKLIDKLHQAGIKVIIGFWGNVSNKNHNTFIKNNWESLKPVISSSDDLNPLSIVKNEYGQEIPFAEYVLTQYQKLKRDFEFDGLFLGDGLMGFRSFIDPYGPYDAYTINNLWTDFYKRIYQGVKKLNSKDTLWAYDCMGNGQTASQKNGLNLADIAPFIDNYIFQSYGNDAWSEDYMYLPGYNLNRDYLHLLSLPKALKLKTRYTIGLGDKIEGWEGNIQTIKSKHQKLAPEAKKGYVGIWTTKVLQELLK